MIRIILFSREESKSMSDFLSSKDLRIHAASSWVNRNKIDLLKNERDFIDVFF